MQKVQSKGNLQRIRNYRVFWLVLTRFKQYLFTTSHYRPFLSIIATEDYININLGRIAGRAKGAIMPLLYQLTNVNPMFLPLICIGHLPCWSKSFYINIELLEKNKIFNIKVQKG